MASYAASVRFPALVESQFLRLLTVFVFYICEGVPMGLFYIAIPAYLAGAGAGAGAIALVVSATGLPWSLKLVNGFLMDRYTYLPMGRRRIWLIGAQSMMILGLLVAAALAPAGDEIWLLAGLAFVISSATTFQDVSIDSLVVDIMSDEEQAKAGGIMFGAQGLGVSGAAAASGLLIENVGISAAYLFAASVLLVGLVYAIMLRERPGEKCMPWSHGAAHPRNLDIKIDAWLPLLKASFKAMVAIGSLMTIPFLLVRQVPSGAGDVFYPIMSTNYAGWGTSDYTNVNSAAVLAASIFGLVIGGYAVARLGPKRMIGIVFPLLALMFAAVAGMPEEWSNTNFLIALFWIQEFLAILFAIAMIPLAMRMCVPAVAATQFTIYMAVGNFGRPIGAWLASVTSIEGGPSAIMFWILAALFAVGAIGIWFVRLPEADPGAQREIEHKVAHGAGTAPEGN